MKPGLFVELHVIQSFAPSNLNRDDVGAPKSCVFGGVPRARISSQCLKRTAREFVREMGLLERSELAERSRRFVSELVEGLVRLGRDRDEARRVVEAALRGADIKVDNDGRTEVLLYLGAKAVSGVIDLCNQHWNELLAAALPAADDGGAGQLGGRGRQARRQAASTIPEEVQKGMRTALAGDRAADLAMFGRMLATLPDMNVDAACQVAHAISTHEVRSELDYWTAVDDLNPEDTAGAGMIGAMEFNSACYYRYLNIDVPQLLEERNLDGDRELARRTLDAFLQASLLATPKGKQNGTAARSPLALAMTVVRTANPLSLVNAFERPVRPTDDSGVVEESMRRLEQHFQRVRRSYGDYAGITQRRLWAEEPDVLEVADDERATTLPDLVQATVAAAFPAGAEATA